MIARISYYRANATAPQSSTALRNIGTGAGLGNRGGRGQTLNLALACKIARNDPDGVRSSFARYEFGGVSACGLGSEKCGRENRERDTSCSSNLPWGYSLIALKSGLLMLAVAGSLLPGVSDLSAKERSDATIRLHIDVAEPTGQIGKHLSGQHDWRLDWLNALDSPIARRCCGYMWSDGAWPAEGEYNWSKLDEKVEAYVAQGRKLILPFSYVPRWLWSDPDDPALNERTVPGQFEFFDHIRIGNTLPPSNYEKWEELIYQTVKHLNVDKQYGVIFEAWNEPNANWFWRGAMEESFELYKHTARAVKRADPNTMIGGPTLAGGPTHRKHSSSGQASGYQWMEAFIKYCAENDVPVDFISWHYSRKLKSRLGSGRTHSSHLLGRTAWSLRFCGRTRHT